jgi:hypothetical protein
VQAVSIFTKRVSQIGSQDLQELLTEQAVENIRLEFKREVPEKDEILKKLSAFANSYGGYIVIGVEAPSTDGRIAGLPGVDPRRGYKQTLVQWCFGGVAPPLEVEVSDPIPTPSGNGKVCYVLYTPESDHAPHFLNGRKGIYVRTDEFSARFEARLATENELRHLLDRRKLILERRSELLSRARRRFRTFAEARYRELSEGKERIGCRFDFSLVPRFPARQLCDHARILSLLNTKRISNWRSVGFPCPRTVFISQHESAIGLSPGSSFSMLEANVWGLLFYASEIEQKRENYSGVHLNHFLGQLLVFIEHACLMLREIAYVGPLIIEMRLESMCGVPWVYFYQGVAPRTGPASELDDEASFSIATTSETLGEKPDRIAMDLIRYVFFAMNWVDAADSDEKLEDLVKSGYLYNRRRAPEKLRV